MSFQSTFHAVGMAARRAGTHRRVGDVGYSLPPARRLGGFSPGSEALSLASGGLGGPAGLTAMAALHRGPGPPSSVFSGIPGGHQPDSFVVSACHHQPEGAPETRRLERPAVLRVETTSCGPGRCSGRRAGNEIQAQLECSRDNSCFWDSVARCPAVGGGLLPLVTRPGAQPEPAHPFAVGRQV